MKLIHHIFIKTEKSLIEKVKSLKDISYKSETVKASRSTYSGSRVGVSIPFQQAQSSFNLLTNYYIYLPITDQNYSCI